jgi:uncharacterized RmlC-like cupin family protein
MTDNKYGDLVKKLSFATLGSGCIRQEINLSGQFLGINASIRYGACWIAGRLGQEPYSPHVHDFDQVVFFLGSDMSDLSELGGEVEFCIGEELETHMITCSTAIAVPKGLPHFPATINRLDRRMIYAEVSIAADYAEKPFQTERKPSGPVGMSSKYGKYFFPLLFRRKSAWTYGPSNRDDGGGSISLLATKEAGVDFVTFYENMKKAPYRLSPDPDKPHAHPTTQVMLFLGTDMDNLNELGAEFEICLGKELERHVFTAPTAVVTPPFLPHWPGGLLKCTRPILMVDVHPFGNEH